MVHCIAKHDIVLLYFFIEQVKAGSVLVIRYEGPKGRYKFLSYILFCRKALKLRNMMRIQFQQGMIQCTLLF